MYVGYLVPFVRKSSMYIDKIKDLQPCDGWQKEWPTEPNTLWWFYGYRYGKSKNASVELLLVAIWKIMNGITYVSEGHFFEKNDGADGVFKRAIPPVPNQTS